MNSSILFTAIRAALEAGKEIMTVYTDPDADFEIERKADNSPLTIADKKAHGKIVSILKATPYPVLSEEGKDIPVEERLKWQELWIVDPLDGTKEFIKRNGEFTVNIAYVKNGIPEAGVIYIPVKKELYFSDADFGAYKVNEIDSTDLQKISSLSALTEKAEQLPYKNISRTEFIIVASRSHLNEETQKYIEDMQQKHRHVKTVSSGSSLKLCLIAEGKADVYPRFAPTMEWDTAAGDAIVRASGGNVFQAGKDTPLSYNKPDLKNPWFIATLQEKA